VGDGGGDAEDSHTDQRGGDRRLQRQRQQPAERRHHDHPTPDPQQPRQQPRNQPDPGRDPTLPGIRPRGPWVRGVGARQPDPPVRGPPEGERSRTRIEVLRVVHSPGRRGGVVLRPAGESGAPGGEGEGEDRGEVVPTATRGAAPRARRPGLLTMAPPMPNRALSIPVRNPSRSESTSRGSPACMAASRPGRAGPSPPPAWRTPRGRRRPPAPPGSSWPAAGARWGRGCGRWAA
jgi:hypothetical protein